MTPAERLKEIHDSWKHDDGPAHDDIEWLVARVKELEIVNIDLVSDGVDRKIIVEYAKLKDRVKQLTETLDLIKKCIPAEKLNAQEHMHIWNCIESEIRAALEDV